MSVRPLESSPDIQVTTGTLLVNRIGLPCHQAPRFGLVHPVTACARDAASSVATLDAAYLSWLISMTSQARFIGARRRKLSGIYDIIGRQSLNMHTSGTV